MISAWTKDILYCITEFYQLTQLHPITVHQTFIVLVSLCLNQGCYTNGMIHSHFLLITWGCLWFQSVSLQTGLSFVSNNMQGNNPLVQSVSGCVPFTGSSKQAIALLIALLCMQFTLVLWLREEVKGCPDHFWSFLHKALVRFFTSTIVMIWVSQDSFLVLLFNNTYILAITDYSTRLHPKLSQPFYSELVALP